MSETEKKEKSRKRRSALDCAIIVIFLAVIYFVGLCLIFLKRPTESEAEKRKLAEKPQFSLSGYFSGQFADDFTVYFSDTVPYREQIVGLVSVMNKYKGIAAPTFYGNVKEVNTDIPAETAAAKPVDKPAETDADKPAERPSVVIEGGQESPDSGNVTEQPAETEAVTEVTEEEELVENIAEFSNNGIVVDGVKMYGDNAGVMLFGGNDPAGTRYAEVISRYKKTLGDDINVYNMVVPTSVEFYLPHKFSLYSTSQKEAIDHIYDSYTADVIPIDAYSEIAKHTDEYIYLRTDHHWSQRGAYYAYKAFCEKLGLDCPDIDKDYEVCTKQNFVGSLYGYTNDVTLKNSPEVFTYYKPTREYHTYYYKPENLSPVGESVLFHEYAEGGHCYGVFMGTDSIHTKIVTGLDTGRKIAVFKESYGNAFIPFLVDNFDEVYVIDIRYFGTNAVQYIRDNGITDVLFIDNIFAANTDKLINDIAALYDNALGSQGGGTVTFDENGNIVTTTAVTTVPETSAETVPDAAATAPVQTSAAETVTETAAVT